MRSRGEGDESTPQIVLGLHELVCQALESTSHLALLPQAWRQDKVLAVNDLPTDRHGVGTLALPLPRSGRRPNLMEDLQ